MYRCFTRVWWKNNPLYPRGLEPESQGRKHTIRKVASEEEAIAICKRYNATHSPGRFSRKAEWEKC